MNIYSKNRTGSYYYRKIYEQHFGKIPIDEEGRTFEIHHLDGDTENNSPENLVAVSIKEHFEIHLRQGDTKACLALAARMKISSAEKKRLASEANQGENNPSFGSRWWNDGENEIRTKTKPVGSQWQPGRSKTLKKKINDSKAQNGTHPSGRMNGRFDHRIHIFKNLVTGEVVHSTQYDFRMSRGLNRKSINRLVCGYFKKFNDWIIEVGP
jgi:hypothetical protein